MLVLTRRVDEQIVVGDPDNPICTITLVGVQGCGSDAAVRLGVTAPRRVQIHRKEIADRIVAGEPQNGGDR